MFTRYGSCLLIHSYRDYFERLPRMLVGEDVGSRPVVDRRSNVLGSGQLHARKFFPSAYEILAVHPFRRLIDVGCGDGEFIAGLLQMRDDVRVAGVDISVVSVQTVKARFGEGISVVLCDGSDVSDWLSRLPLSDESTVVTLWYVVHEFTRGEVARGVEFFRSLRAELPTAEVILGEIVSVASEVLADSHSASIMPEFLLFHALSGQGVFTWEQHQDLLAQIPYSLAAEVRFDEVGTGPGDTTPSSFIWHLRPSEERDG